MLKKFLLLIISCFLIISCKKEVPLAHEYLIGSWKLYASTVTLDISKTIVFSVDNIYVSGDGYNWKGSYNFDGIKLSIYWESGPALGCYTSNTITKISETEIWLTGRLIGTLSGSATEKFKKNS